MKVIIADFSERKTVENLMQLYLHDLSVYTGANHNGLFDLGKYFNRMMQRAQIYLILQ